MLPIAKLECPLSIDFMPMVNSGILVPNAMTVAPITCWATPREAAMEIADSTIKLALTTTHKAPIMVNKIELLKGAVTMLV